MNSRTTLFLVVLVALVGGFVFWDHFKGMSTSERESKSKRLVEFEVNDITGLDLVHSNQTIVLAKSGENWDLKQPLAVRADFSAVSSILDELEFAERERTITEKELSGVSLVDFGLDSPAMRVTLHSKKRPVGLLVGHETPTKDALYVQVEGHREVYVVRKSIQERLNQTVEALRSRTAIEFTPSAATRLEIKAADRVIEMSRTNTEARWTLTRPLLARADQTKVSELLTDLNGLRIQDFVSEDPKDAHTFQLDEPEREVTVYTGDAGQTIVFSRPLTNDASKVHAKLKAGNSVFTVSAEVAKKCTVQINDLRDPRVLTFDPAAVKKIEILQGTNKIALTGSNHVWTLTAPVAVAADDDAVRQLLHDLDGLKAKQFTADVATDLDRYGLAAPATTISLLGEGTNVLLVGSLDASNSVLYVKRADEPFIYGVETNAIAVNPGSLRTRQVFDLKSDQVTKLVAGNTTVARDGSGKWKLVAPAQGVLDTDSLNHLLDAFCQLRAEEFGEPYTDVAPPTLTVTVGETTHWIVIDKDGQAVADACELRFKLSEPVVRTLTKDLVAVPPGHD